MARAKTVFECKSCGQDAAKWFGKCPSCDGWNTLVEKAKSTEPKTAGHQARSFRLPNSKSDGAVPLNEISGEATSRTTTSISELDRVLGGGLVPGSLVLVGGDPGIGKSTLLLQATQGLAAIGPVLYVTGEESPEQVKLRADRLRIDGDRILLLAETRTDKILQAIEKHQPSALVVDSIQTVYDPEVSSAPGSVTQIREVAARFLYIAKSNRLPTFLVGHVTKGGDLAGPRVLEHMVDTVLYFENTSGQPFRILRAHKNRFGSTNEIGVFEMRNDGLRAVENPSELFVGQRAQEAPGSVILPALEGTRPFLVEIQALVSLSNLGTPRRTCLGFENQRAAMLVAVLERCASLDILGSDIFINVAGGLGISEPAADLAVAAALASSFRNEAFDAGTVFFGEIGLSGELRAVTQAGARLKEAAKLGFTRAIVANGCLARVEQPKGIEVSGARTVGEALGRAFGS